MTPERKKKFEEVAARRQPDLTVILENVTDQHNIGAVLRSCDSVGVSRIYILNTEPHLATDTVIIGKKTSSGARKWVDVLYFTDPEACFLQVRQHCRFIYSTKLGEDSTDLFNLDLTQPVALLFGNEHSGLSKEALSHSDGNFVIPQVGMVKSLNISVACAVSLYEAYRQRRLKGFYDESRMPEAEYQALLLEYFERHKTRGRTRKIIRKQG
ncbi:MAG: TrmH family RNA methyltransferase [Saprospiraceae bacterium]